MCLIFCVHSGIVQGARISADAGAEIITKILNETNALLTLSIQTVDGQSAAATDKANMDIMVMLIVAVAVLVLSLGMAFVTASIIEKPVKQLVGVADNVAKGNLNVNIDTGSNDEIGMLAKSFHSVVQSVNNMITDIEKMHQHHENGEMSYHIDTSGYQGAYKNVAAGVDETIHSYVAMIGDIFGALESFGQGDDGFVFQAVKNAALRSKILAQAAKASP